MQSKLSVLQVIPNLNISGAEQGCIDIAESLVKENFNSYIVTSSGVKIDHAIKSGSKIILLPVNKKNLFVIILNIIRLKNIIKKYNIDLLHVRSRVS